MSIVYDLVTGKDIVAQNFVNTNNNKYFRITVLCWEPVCNPTVSLKPTAFRVIFKKWKLCNEKGFNQIL